ncbi:hypothetical protein EON77_16665, partial [bacterium]
MPQMSMSEYAERLRRAGALGEAERDKLLAYAITQLEDFKDHCALLLSLAAAYPSEPVKLALYYNCNKHNETAASCAALLCYLCGKAASPFDPELAPLVALFEKHTNSFQRADGLDRLTALTGYTTQSPEDFCFLDVPAAEQAPAPASTPMPSEPPPRPSPRANRPPPLPAASPARRLSTASTSGLSDVYEIESEMRGETIHYVESTRRASMQFFWTRGYQIHADTITSWWYPAQKRSVPVTPQERIDIVARVVEYASRVQGVSMEVVAEGWMYAQRLHEEIAQMRAAEAEVLGATTSLGAFATLAVHWRGRVVTLAKAGRTEDAINAYHRGAMWADRYAAGATSGGEGTALSGERDVLIRDLRGALGGIDPGHDRKGN